MLESLVMFETARFKTLLKETIAGEATNQGFTQYEIGIVDLLQLRATENASVLMERELRKSPGMRRGISDALSSAREIIVLASAYAVADKRTVLRVSDVDAALSGTSFRAWPFIRI